MNAPDFLDANVLVYAYDPSDRRKQRVARELLRRALAGEAVFSVQVLSEFAKTLLHKKSPPAKPEDVMTALDAFAPIGVIAPDAAMVLRAVEAHGRYGMHFWAGMIVAAAERGACGRILSEDLNSGQRCFGVMVENPFSSPE